MYILYMYHSAETDITSRYFCVCSQALLHSAKLMNINSMKNLVNGYVIICELFFAPLKLASS